MGEFEIGEQPRHAGVEHRVAVPARLLGERARQPRLADTARAGDEQIAMLGDPFAGGELLEQRLVEPSRRPVVDVLDRRLAMAQLGAAQPDLKALGVAIGRLAIEQQRQPFGMCEIDSLVLALQLDEGVGQAAAMSMVRLVCGNARRTILPLWRMIGGSKCIETTQATDPMADEPREKVFAPPSWMDATGL